MVLIIRRRLLRWQKLNTVRVLLSFAANLDWPLFQLNVKNAFLNGDLEEEVYMDIPPGLRSETTNNCKLKKSLYGLKQSPGAWFDQFSKALKRDLGICSVRQIILFSSNNQYKVNHPFSLSMLTTLFLQGTSWKKWTMKNLIANEFEIKNLGTLKYFLGMEVARTKDGILVSQQKYVLDLLKELECSDASHPADTPMDPNIKLGNGEKNTPVNKGRYQRHVGKLIYLSHTRPEIGFSVSVVSQFMNNPMEEHMAAVYHILRYLKMIPGKGLYFKKDTNMRIEVFTDADWAGSITNRRSTSRYCTFIWGNLVTWRSKKQTVVSRSSAAPEFKAMAHGICEGIWLKRLLKELRIQDEEPLHMFCDNPATISIAKNPVHHDRTKHVEIDHHFIKEKLKNGVILLQYTPTKCQIADILTKTLPICHLLRI